MKKGISLVALVITIIVLLILAGATVIIAFNTGLLENAKTAADGFNEKQLEEKIYYVGITAKQNYRFSSKVDEEGNTITIKQFVMQEILDEFQGAYAQKNYIRFPNSEKRVVVDEKGNVSIKELDFIEGYRANQLSGSYNLYAEWLTNDIVNLRHQGASYGGPAQAYKCFIADKENLFGSTSAAPAIEGASTDPIPTFENGKTYKFTAKVVKVNYNDATEEVDGTLRMGCGRRGNVLANIGEYNISEIKEGTEFSFTFTIDTSNYAKQVSAFYFGSSGAFKWSFDFEIKIEEVK